jgi:hypothetical protein
MQAALAANHYRRLPNKIATLAALVIAADILFYGHAVGVSAALFMLLLVAATWHFNRLNYKDPAAGLALLLAAVGWLALIENVSWLSAGFALAGSIGVALACRVDWVRDGARWLERVLRFAALGWTRAFRDAGAFRKVRKKGRYALISRRQLIAWILPAGFSLVFVTLFAEANPVISDWLAVIASIDLSYLFAPGRWVFWLIAAILCWPFIRPRLRRRARKPRTDTAPRSGLTVPSGIGILFSTDAVLRSLLVFNALFAVQTALDAAYLWGGQSLPDGMTYAQYAHRGAYPLMFVALLAAVFVLIAMRPGSESARSRLVRGLVYVWIAQTIILVGASLWRLGLYVSVYSLTYLRVAALVWMVLVALGLGWIVLRLVWDKSSAWLVRANMLTAMAVLYLCCFIDFGGAIARFNVEHSREVTGRGGALDIGYLHSVGPSAVPALVWYLDNGNPGSEGETGVKLVLAGLSSKLDAQHENWRGYTFRSYRLNLHPAMAQSDHLSRTLSRWRFDN